MGIVDKIKERKLRWADFMSENGGIDHVYLINTEATTPESRKVINCPM